MIFSFIIFLNGVGFIYVGAKTSNAGWVKEGIIYELPWILSIITLENDFVSPIFMIFGLLLLLISIIRSFMIRSEYMELQSQHKYKESKIKILSLIICVVGIMPIINGIVFIIEGIKHSSKRLIIEGAIYEFIWVPFFIYIDSTTALAYVINHFCVASLLISFIRSIIMNYECDSLYKWVDKPISTNQSNALQGNKTVNNQMGENPLSEKIDDKLDDSNSKAESINKGLMNLIK